MTDCTYCGREIEAHDPLWIEERDGGERVPAGRFCNWACLSSHIDEEDLTTGDACEWTPT
jgi:hypothetical protein